MICCSVLLNMQPTKQLRWTHSGDNNRKVFNPPLLLCNIILVLVRTSSQVSTDLIFSINTIIFCFVNVFFIQYNINYTKQYLFALRCLVTLNRRQTRTIPFFLVVCSNSFFKDNQLICLLAINLLHLIIVIQFRFEFVAAEIRPESMYSLFY